MFNVQELCPQNSWDRSYRSDTSDKSDLSDKIPSAASRWYASGELAACFTMMLVRAAQRQRTSIPAPRKYSPRPPFLSLRPCPPTALRSGVLLGDRSLR